MLAMSGLIKVDLLMEIVQFSGNFSGIDVRLEELDFENIDMRLIRKHGIVRDGMQSAPQYGFGMDACHK